ncbi:MAG TPA: hypothetical protein VFM88_13200 [Vicinamibacteria bacterium]|nr:hypothetical protein [Vicinamibacteria bacterium]
MHVPVRRAHVPAALAAGVFVSFRLRFLVLVLLLGIRLGGPVI